MIRASQGAWVVVRAGQAFRRLARPAINSALTATSTMHLSESAVKGIVGDDMHLAITSARSSRGS